MNIISQQLESINESSLLTSRKINGNKYFGGAAFSIHIDPDTNRNNGFILDPYFKLYNSYNANSATASIRISMKDARIIYHNDGKEDIAITKKLLEDLNKVMILPCTLNKYRGISVYDAFYIELANAFIGQTTIKFELPDFTKAYGYNNGGVKLC